MRAAMIDSMGALENIVELPGCTQQPSVVMCSGYYPKVHSGSSELRALLRVFASR